MAGRTQDIAGRWTSSVRLVFACVLAALWLAPLTIHAGRTNIVLAVADDMGWSDLGCYGGEIRTPAIDRLAANGLRFRSFYNAARCSPTRCALLTGLYTQQVAVDPANALPNLRTDNNVTLAELLQAHGYRTYMAGKWHLGTVTGRNPWERGFQHFWGFAAGAQADQWLPSQYSLVSENNEITNRVYGAGEFYQPDAIGDYALDFLNHHFGKNDGAPFFLYLAFGSAHFPIQAPGTLADAYVPVYAPGWDAVREARYQRMFAQGIIGPHFPLSPRGGTAPHQSEPVEEIPAWNTLPADRQADLARRMALYAGMIEAMDRNLGRVIQRLEQAGELHQTLVLFLSDNGGNHEGGRFGRTGTTVNAPPLTGSDLENMGQNGQPWIYLGGGWANVNNTPFRLFKHFIHDGGVRTPLIVHWPEGLSRTNVWVEQPGHVIDVMATVVDLTGATYPTQFNGHPVLPLEGQSLRPWFNGAPILDRQIAFEHESNRGLVSGPWKLVTKNFELYDGSSPAHELELYHLGADPVELTNLAALYPARVSQMVAQWNAWAARVGVPSGRWLPSVPLNLSPAPQPGDLFLDTFARNDATDIDAATGGMSGSRVPPLGPNATYYEGFEGSGSATSIQIVNGALQMAVGNGMSENGLRHNFIGQDIVDAGGFSVELTVLDISTDVSDATNRFVGFAVGLSEAEAATGWDINNALGPGAVAFRGRPGGNTGVADFLVELDLNGYVKVWRNGTILETALVGTNRGTLTAAFALNGFRTNSTVTVTVFFNGRVVDLNKADSASVSRTFQWDRNDSNHIGLTARASNFAQMDNFAVRKLPLSPTLAMGYALRAGLSGPATAPEADPDEDGLSNLGEWAFGGDPAAPDAAAAELQIKEVTAANGFQFEHRRRKDFIAAGVSYQVLTSDNLADWTPASPVVNGTRPVPDLPEYEIVQLQLFGPDLAGKDRLFVRVKAHAQ